MEVPKTGVMTSYNLISSLPVPLNGTFVLLKIILLSFLSELPEGNEIYVFSIHAGNDDF